MPEKKDHPKATTCEVCDYHLDFNDLLVNASADLKWIKRVSYGILVVAGTFALSMWSVFFPYLVQVGDRIQSLDAALKVSIEKISQLEQTDAESKSDRREIRRSIEDINRRLPARQ